MGEREPDEQKISSMTLEEFKEYCYKNDYNIVDEWPHDRFLVICKKCIKPEQIIEEITKDVVNELSDYKNAEGNVIITKRNEKGAMGSEYTGYMTGYIHNAGMLIKCKKCGNAVVITVPNY